MYTVVVLYSCRNVSLSQYLGKGENLLLVLLRHFGWQPWRDHLTELKDSKVRQPAINEDKNCTAATKHSQKQTSDISAYGHLLGEYLVDPAVVLARQNIVLLFWNVPKSALPCSLNHQPCFCFFLIQKLLEAQSLRVLVVSYGSLEGATFWLGQTGYEFDMLLDAERVVRKSIISFCFA